MRITVHNHSSYPRVAKGDVAAIIAHQEAAGCDVVTDGLAPWADPFAIVFDSTDGVSRGAAMPYFGTEVTVHRPLIDAALKRRQPLAVKALAEARKTAHKPVKAVLPGPYTLARSAELGSGPYRSMAALAAAFATLLAEEVAALAAAGAAYVQIEEPAIIGHADDIRLLRELFEPLWAARGEAQIVLATWGAGSAPLYAQLNSVPADIVAIDLVRNPDLDAMIEATGASKVLALGIYDGDKQQAGAALARRVEPLLKRYDLDELVLCSPSGLRLHTGARAFDILQQLSAAAAILRKADQHS